MALRLSVDRGTEALGIERGIERVVDGVGVLRRQLAAVGDRTPRRTRRPPAALGRRTFALSLAHWLWFRTCRAEVRSSARRRSARSAPSLILAVIAIVVAVAATANVVQIGDTGAQAVWSTPKNSSTAVPASGK